jgi:hypothetical protein
MWIKKNPSESLKGFALLSFIKLNQTCNMPPREETQTCHTLSLAIIHFILLSGSKCRRILFTVANLFSALNDKVHWVMGITLISNNNFAFMIYH